MSHTVLVVEDEADLREMIRDGLELNGYAVVTAEDGQDALDKIAGIETVCLVILDLLMPVMNGWDFVQKMRQRSELASIPVVVHTSAPGPSARGRHPRPSEASDVRPAPLHGAGVLRPVARGHVLGYLNPTIILPTKSFDAPVRPSPTPTLSLTCFHARTLMTSNR